MLECGRCSHYQLADRIKSIAGRVDLVVVDQFTEKWYRERQMLLTDKTKRPPAAPASTSSAEIMEQATVVDVETTPTIEGLTLSLCFLVEHSASRRGLSRGHGFKSRGPGHKSANQTVQFSWEEKLVAIVV